MTFHRERHHQRCACGSVLGSRARFRDPKRFVLPGTERVYERPRPFRVAHIDLDLGLDHRRGRIDGVAVLSLERVASDATFIRLDGIGFEISSVEFRAGRKGWAATAYTYDGETLTIEVGTAANPRIRVRYVAYPRRGMYFLAPDDEVPERPRQIWTQCQDEDARHIFPCHDKPHNKQTFETTIRVERGWVVLSNGDPTGSEAKRKKGCFSFAMRDPMPSYLFTCVAGAFAIIEDATAGDLPVHYYVPPGREAEGARSFRNTPTMIELFGRLTGVAYPWTKYHQVVVHDFIFGGMENTGATTMYEHVLLSERAERDITSDDLIAHELAHQWFGDLVTCRDWSHGWLNEGFATYFEHVWREHDRGLDDHLYGLRGDLDQYLSEARGRYQRPVVCQDYEAPIDIFDRHLYEKGGLFLHTLRTRLGDTSFWGGVNAYLEAHAHGVVETTDLLRALETASGQSLERAFHEALYRAEFPDVRFSVVHEDDVLLVHVTQRQGQASDVPFALSVELDVTVGRRTERWTRTVTERQATLAFPVRSRPKMVVIDPRLRILGRVELKVPADMLRHQLAKAASGYAQALAAEALGHRDDPATVKALGRAVMDGKKFWGARATAATALGGIRSEAAFNQLGRAVAVDDSRVRRAVATALGQFKSDEAARRLEPLARHDESLLVGAAASRALGATRRDVRGVLVALIDRESWADTLRAGAVGGLAALRDDEAVEALLKATAYGVPNRGRRAAILALPRLSQSRRVREHMEGLLDDADPYVRTTVVMALSSLGDPRARAALSRQLDRDLDGRVRRRIREVLRDLTGKGRREVKRLQEALEEVSREHQALEARLAKLEALTLER
ncbi:MAG: M1 family aminopeptidase [Myxococcota bacterium]